MFFAHRPLAILLFLFFCINAQSKETLVVKTQSDFDNLNTEINTLLNGSSNNIDIIIQPGIYLFKDQHILIDDKRCFDKTIRIRGYGATLISEGNLLKKGDRFGHPFRDNNAFVDKYGHLIQIWSRVKTAEGRIEIIDENTKLCRLKYTEFHNKTEDDCKNAFIKIPHWFKMSRYSIRKIEDGFIYFRAVDLKESFFMNGWNINDDYNYDNESDIRFFVCNIEEDSTDLHINNDIVCCSRDYGLIRECMAERLLSVSNSSFKKLSISGLKILGNAYYGNYLIQFNNVISDGISIKSVSFRGLKSNVISLSSTSNVTVEKCSFCECYRGCIFSDIRSIKTSVINCDFKKVGLEFEDSFAIKCQGDCYYVASNTFEDYGYGAINVGLVPARRPEDAASGLVEKNKISYTEDYARIASMAGIMDGGAIYVSTRNKNAVIRYNVINGHTGYKDNRGIFLDDGAYNTQVYCNVIMNITNSYCVDARRVDLDAYSNTNNCIKDNIVDGNIRFAGSDIENNGCILDANYILTSDSTMVHNKYQNVRTLAPDIIVQYRNAKGNLLLVNRYDYKRLKKSGAWHLSKNLICK